MCAILDANVAGLVFASRTTEAENESASKRFFDWIDSGAGSLIAGGKLLSELDKVSNFQKWRKRAVSTGRITILDGNSVNQKASQVAPRCKSNDPHVIAVALISNARFLYSNDEKLQKDFRNSNLVNNPRGSVYSTRYNKNFTQKHRRLLRQNPCRHRQ